MLRLKFIIVVLLLFTLNNSLFSNIVPISLNYSFAQYYSIRPAYLTINAFPGFFIICGFAGPFMLKGHFRLAMLALFSISVVGEGFMISAESIYPLSKLANK